MDPNKIPGIPGPAEVYRMRFKKRTAEDAKKKKEGRLEGETFGDILRARIEERDRAKQEEDDGRE